MKKPVLGNPDNLKCEICCAHTPVKQCTVCLWLHCAECFDSGGQVCGGCKWAMRKTRTTFEMEEQTA